MPDPADLADLDIEAAVNAQIAKITVHAPKIPAVSPECDECGYDIPIARRNLGYTTCIECQTALETVNKHRRHP